MSKLLFTIHTVAKHPCGRLSEHTYDVTALNRYDAIDQVIDSIHSYGLTVVSWTIQNTKEITPAKGADK